MKFCIKCNTTKELSSFVIDKRRKDGHYPYCKECAKGYYEANRTRLLAQKKEYNSRPEIKERLRPLFKARYELNKEFRIQQRQEYYSMVENRSKLMFFKSRDRALAEGHEFTITVDDIIIPTHCPYLGIELTHVLGKGQLETNSSLDRIDSTKGYIPGNVQVISRLANTMKNSATDEQLKTFALNILRIQGTNLSKYIEAITNV